MLLQLLQLKIALFAGGECIVPPTNFSMRLSGFHRVLLFQISTGTFQMAVFPDVYKLLNE